MKINEKRKIYHLVHEGRGKIPRGKGRAGEDLCFLSILDFPSSIYTAYT